jgi:predicted component of type VI protein secretion system
MIEALMCVSDGPRSVTAEQQNALARNGVTDDSLNKLMDKHRDTNSWVQAHRVRNALEILLNAYQGGCRMDAEYGLPFWDPCSVGNEQWRRNYLIHIKKLIQSYEARILEPIVRLGEMGPGVFGVEIEGYLRHADQRTGERYRYHAEWSGVGQRVRVRLY